MLDSYGVGVNVIFTWVYRTLIVIGIFQLFVGDVILTSYCVLRAKQSVEYNCILLPNTLLNKLLYRVVLPEILNPK